MSEIVVRELVAASIGWRYGVPVDGFERPTLVVEARGLFPFTAMGSCSSSCGSLRSRRCCGGAPDCAPIDAGARPGRRGDRDGRVRCRRD